MNKTALPACTLPAPRWADHGPALLLALIFTALSLLAPVGIQGWDDARYLEGAQAWLQQGVTRPENHWQARLPYVWLIAGAVWLLGPTETALFALHALLFLAMMLLLHAIALQIAGRVAALLAVLAAGLTPLFLRLPTLFYPEALEVACTGLCVLLVLRAAKRAGGGRVALLLAAGLAGGITLLVRQTALAVPAALAVWLLLQPGRSLAARLGDVAWLALGHAVPLVLEMLFYLALTGNPLQRLAIDMRHVLIPSSHLQGDVYRDGSPLFNWTLAARWSVPSVITAHWAIMPVVRLFTTPGALLTPWLALAGGVIAWRLGGAHRRFTILVLATFVAQFVFNTFVLVIAPNTRYFASSLYLGCVLVGIGLAALAAVPRLLPLGTMLVACLGVAAVTPSPRALLAPLRAFTANGQPVHVSAMMGDVTVFARLADPALRNGLVIDTRNEGPKALPPGALAVLEQYTWTTERFAGLCPDGAARWDSLATMQPESLPWRVLQALDLSRHVPDGAARYLARRQDAVSLLRARC